MNKPPIADVLDHYGASFVPTRHGWAKMRCPFHEDRDASASVNTDEDMFKCHAGCDIAGDSFDVIAWKEGFSDFPSTVEFAETVFGGSYGDVLPATPGQSRRRVFGESRPKRGQRNAFQARLRRRTFDRP